MLKDDYNQRKQKFKDNSDLMALNSSFKIIRNSLDDVKTLISELEDTKAIRAKMHEYKKSLVEKEEYSSSVELYNESKFQKAKLEEFQKYTEKRQEIMDKLENPSITGKIPY